jgi:hypothetical protein
MIMAETLKKAAEATAKAQQKVAAAVASARTRKGEPKVTKAPKTPKPDITPDEAAVLTTPFKVARLDAFIAYETDLLAAVAVPEDTGDAMFNAVQAVLYHKERITKAELAKKYLTED